MAKNIRGLLENLTDYFLNIIVNKKLKLMGGAMKYFLKKLLGHEIFRSMVSWTTKNFLKNL